MKLKIVELLNGFYSNINPTSQPKYIIRNLDIKVALRVNNEFDKNIKDVKYFNSHKEALECKILLERILERERKIKLYV
jgi:hypothetical protein